jgi:hypothetical protein
MTKVGNTVLVFIPAVVATGREANHSPPPNVEVKNQWSYASTLIFIHGVHRNKFNIIDKIFC